VNERGAPIEFWHTTESPIKINRLQALLYGKTLMPELIGRHITGTLLSDEHGEPRIKPSLQGCLINVEYKPGEGVKVASTHRIFPFPEEVLLSA
jgi:hypothetical protein